MPKGTPSLGSQVEPLPKAEVLGMVDERLLQPGPQGPTTQWSGPSGDINLAEAPPPWESEDQGHDTSDARRFVEVPDSWTLRWINPKVLDSMGWRYWQPVMASDKRVKVKVATLVGPDNNIRRGGHVGDILAWMPTHWVESRRRLLQQETERLTASAVDHQEELKEDFKRGKYGATRLTAAQHPTHTMADPRSMTDQ